jgi:hypothetical protein
MEKNFITAHVGDATGHDPWWRTFKKLTDQVLKSLNVFFWSPSSIFFLLSLVTLGEYESHRYLH